MLPPRFAWLLSLAALIGVFAGCTSATPAAAPGKPATAPALQSTAPALPAVSLAKPMTPASVEQRYRQLVGDWHGRQPAKEGGAVEWIMRRSGDGTFQVTFRNFDTAGNLTKESTEVGYWGVSGDLVMTHTLGWLRAGGRIDQAPADDPYFWDAYRILEFAENRVRYVSVETGNEYIVTRLAPGSTFPSSEPKL